LRSHSIPGKTRCRSISLHYVIVWYTFVDDGMVWCTVSEFMGEGRLDRQLAIRVSHEDVQRLDALKKRIAIASRNAIARSALRLGIELLEADPARAMSEPGAKKPPPKRDRR
jgi:hypothetical protein